MSGQSSLRKLHWVSTKKTKMKSEHSPVLFFIQIANRSSEAAPNWQCKMTPLAAGSFYDTPLKTAGY